MIRVFKIFAWAIIVLFTASLAVGAIYIAQAIVRS